MSSKGGHLLTLESSFWDLSQFTPHLLTLSRWVNWTWIEAKLLLWDGEISLCCFCFAAHTIFYTTQFLMQLAISFPLPFSVQSIQFWNIFPSSSCFSILPHPQPRATADAEIACLIILKAWVSRRSSGEKLIKVSGQKEKRKTKWSVCPCVHVFF